MNKTFDFILIGQGLTALATLAFLKDTPYQVLWLTPQTPLENTSASFGQQRLTALSAASARLLATVGLPVLGLPLLRIVVSRAGEFGSVVLTACEAAVKALGYIVDNKELALAFEGFAPKNLCVVAIAPGFVWQSGAKQVQVIAADLAAAPLTFSGRALLLADGLSPPVLAFLEKTLGFSQPKAEQTAIVLQAETINAPEATAFERFTRNGVLAALPLHQEAEKTNFSLVWSWRGDLPSQDKDFWWQALTKEFAGLLGAWQQATPPVFYPLAPFCVSRLAFDRVLLLGNAAQTLHPVAGQGFNLILRDLATLRWLLATGKSYTRQGDLSALFLRYQKLRALDRFSTFAFTQMLSQLPLPGAALLAVDSFNILKKIIEKQGLGWKFPLPPLATVRAEDFQVWQ